MSLKATLYTRTFIDMTTIEYVLQTHGFLEEELNQHYFYVLLTMPKNQWFVPNNKNNEEYTICWWFASRGLICKKQIPRFVKGSYMGMTDWYYWNEDLNYREVS
jgi:hypothetical protein